jgi:phosphoribosylaminoimidazole-succinocarboxamide synthase
MAEYRTKGTVCDIRLPPGLVESQKLETPLFTPSTKAEIGEHGFLNLIQMKISIQASYQQ